MRTAVRPIASARSTAQTLAGLIPLVLATLVAALTCAVHLTSTNAHHGASRVLTSSADDGSRFVPADGHDHLRGSAEPERTPELTGAEAENSEEGSHLAPSFVTFPQLRFTSRRVLAKRTVRNCNAAPPRQSAASAALPRGPPAIHR